MSHAPEIYAIIHENGIEPFNPTTCKETAKAWVKRGYTVSIFTETGTANTVRELEE